MPMSKMDWILATTTPGMSIAASLLRAKDDNSTGADDLTADILDYGVAAIHAIQFGLPMPDLPASLRPKVKAEDQNQNNVLDSSQNIQKEEKKDGSNLQ